MGLRRAILLVLPLGMSFSGTLMAGSPEEVFRQVAASIVVVEVSGVKGEAISLGSGVIIAPGQVITNCHVIKDGKTFTIRQSNQTGNQPQPASVRYRAEAWYNYSQGNHRKVREIYQTLRKLDMELADKYFNALILP